jgi:ribosomal protein S18 acetylase RimI-like enzyme
VDEQGVAQGFVGRFQTGQDLFRPLVTMRCRTAGAARELLKLALAPGRPYIFFANLNQLSLAAEGLRLENERIFSIYRLEVTCFQPVINVLVQHKTAANGAPRCEIRSGEVAAVAGVNWQSPSFAEIYVETDPAVRERGWGRSVVTALCERLLRDGRFPLYLVEPRNEASCALAESVGFVDTGSRQVYADATYQAADQPTSTQ